MAGFSIGGVNVGGGTGAAAKKGCGGGCGAVFGIIFGIILIPVGFYLAYHAEAKLVNHAKIFEGVEMVQPDAAKGMEGQLVKIQGQPQGDFLTIEEWDGKALYYYKETEEFEEERDSEGDVTRQWDTVSSDSGWVDSFTVAGITIRPEGAKVNPVGEEEVYSAYMKRYETAFHEGTDQSNPEVGDRRKSVDVLDATKTVIVLGQMTGGTIQGGQSFVVSTQNEQQTLETLKTEYKLAKWGMRAGAVFCIFFGIMAIFGPLTTLVGYVPLVGDHLSCAFAGIAFVFALVSVTIVTLFIKAFWFLIAIVVLGVAFMIYRGIKSPRHGPGGGATAAGPEQPVPPAQPAQPAQPAPPTQPSPPTTGQSQAGTGATLPPGAAAGVPRPSAPPEETQPAEDAGPAPQTETPAERPAAFDADFMRPAEPSQEQPPPSGPVESEFMRPAEPSEGAEPEEGPKFCANCGAKLDPGSKFCRECGQQVQ